MPSLRYAIVRSWGEDSNKLIAKSFMQNIEPHLDELEAIYYERTGSKDGFKGFLTDVLGLYLGIVMLYAASDDKHGKQSFLQIFDDMATRLANRAKIVPAKQSFVSYDSFDIRSAGEVQTVVGTPRLMPFGHDAFLLPKNVPFFRYTARNMGTDEFLKLNDYEVAVFKNGSYQGTASRAMAFSEAVGKLSNADAFLGTFNLWQQDLMWRAGLALHFIRVNGSKMDPAIPALMGVHEFYRAGMPAFRKHLSTVAGDNRLMQTFAGMHMAAVNNLIAPLCVFISELDGATADKSLFREVVTDLEPFFDPFAHIRSTYMPANGEKGIDTQVEGGETKWNWDGNIGNAIQLESFIGAVAYMAALAKAKVRVSWEERVKGVRFEIEGATIDELRLADYAHLVHEMSPKVGIQFSSKRLNGGNRSTVIVGPFNQGGRPSIRPPSKGELLAINPQIEWFDEEDLPLTNRQRASRIFMTDRFTSEGCLDLIVPLETFTNYYGVMTTLGLTDVTMAPLGTAAYALAATVGVTPFYARVM